MVRVASVDLSPLVPAPSNFPAAAGLAAAAARPCQITEPQLWLHCAKPRLAYFLLSPVVCGYSACQVPGPALSKAFMLGILLAIHTPRFQLCLHGPTQVSKQLAGMFLKLLLGMLSTRINASANPAQNLNAVAGQVCVPHPVDRDRVISWPSCCLPLPPAAAAAPAAAVPCV
jgi:hypothetical protein